MIDIILILPTACAGIKGFFVLIKRRQLRKLFQLMYQMDKLVRSVEHQAIIKQELSASILLVKILSGFIIQQ